MAGGAEQGVCPAVPAAARPRRKRAASPGPVGEGSPPALGPPVGACLQARAAADGGGDDFHDHDLDEQAGCIGAI